MKSPKVDLVVLSVIPKELAAARSALHLPANVSHTSSGGTHYWIGKAPKSKHRLALACIGNAGNPDCAAAATEAIHEFNPRALILMGIAAGLKGKVKIGDVVLSERVVAYEPASQEKDGVQLQRPEVVRMNHQTEQDVANYLSQLDAKRVTDVFLAGKGCFPEAPKGQVKTYAQHVASALIKVKSATVASGEKLLKDPNIIHVWRDKIHGKIEAGEMEASGLYAACHRASVPWLVIRGISDFGDEFKNDSFHDFAAKAAASVLADFLACGLHLKHESKKKKSVAIRADQENVLVVHNSGQLKKAELRYRELALEACDIIDLAGLPEDRHSAAKKILTRQLYVPLHLQVETDKGGDGDVGLGVIERQRNSARLAAAGRSSPEWLREQGTIDTIGARLKKSRCLVVLGDPGGGKSTLIRWLATAYMLRLKKDPDWKKIPAVATLPQRDWLPIVVRCRELLQEQFASTLDDVLTWTLRKAEMSAEEALMLPSVLKARMRSGNALLLIDGLDEITNPRARAGFCRQVETISAAYPLAAIVVTSRIVGYREMGLKIGREFEHATLAALSSEEKDEFARRWCALTEQPGKQDQKAVELIKAIHGNDRVERLTDNPMLLTTLALVKRKVGKLPNRRAKLYSEAIQVLLDWRSEVDDPIDDREALPQLEYIAFEMCRRGVQQLREDELIDLLDQVRSEFPNIRPINNRNPEQFLRVLEQRTSILIQSGTTQYDGMSVPVFEFRHLTFQEYLAGLALVRGHFPGCDAKSRLADRVIPIAQVAVGASAAAKKSSRADISEDWKEALRLCVSICNDSDVDDVLSVIGQPLDGESEDVSRSRVLLSALCLADEPDVSAALGLSIVQRLIEKAQAGDENVELEDDEVYAQVCLELSVSDWSSTLLSGLINAHLSDNAKNLNFFAGIIGRLGFENAPEPRSEEFRRWVGLRVVDISSGELRRAIPSALSVMHAAFRHCDVVVAGMVDGLFDMLKGNVTESVHAGAWALAWVTNAFSDRATRSGKDTHKTQWEITPTRLDELVGVLVRCRSQCLWFVGSIIASTRDRRLLEVLKNRVPFDSPEERGIAASLLGRVYGSTGTANPEVIGLLSGMLKDESQDVRMSAFRALLVIAGGKLELTTVAYDGDGIKDPKSPVTKAVVEKLAKAHEISVSQFVRELEVFSQNVGWGINWSLD